MKEHDEGDNSNPQEDHKLPDWMVVLDIDMPRGTALHPAFYSHVEHVLEQRIPVLDCGVDHLGVAFTGIGTNLPEVKKEARVVAGDLLRLLSLGHEALTRLDVEPFLTVEDQIRLHTTDDPND